MSVITIARQFGAGGKTLGNRVAERLGYTLIDEQIVEMVALEAGVSPQWVDSIAREAGGEGVVQRVIRKFGPFRTGYVESAVEERPGYINGDLYISLLHKVIPVLAEQNDVVILGRGGQFILGDRPDTYHFLMIAHRENRIRFMMGEYHLDRKKAQLVIDKRNKRRINLYRNFGQDSYDQPDHYHMVLNMNLLRLDEAVRLICQLVAG